MSMKFWMVWNERRDVPSHKHPSAEEARREAERLARTNPGQQFHVLELMATCSKNDIQWENAEEDQPF